MIDRYKIINDMRKADALYNDFIVWVDMNTTSDNEKRANSLKQMAKRKYNNIIMYFDDIENLLSKHQIRI